ISKLGRVSVSDIAVLLAAIAEAHEAAAATLRHRVAALSPAPADGHPLTAVQRARIMNPQLGPRQAEIIEILEDKYPEGTDTGYLWRTTGQDQPNVYLTVNGLRQQGIVEKDATTRPHQYRLSSEFMSDGE